MNYLDDEDYIAVCLYELRKAENALSGLNKDNTGPERIRRTARVEECLEAYNTALAITKKSPQTP